MSSSGERISRTSSQLTSSIKTEQVTVRRKIRSLTIVSRNRTWSEMDRLFSGNRRRTISSSYKLSVQWQIHSRCIRCQGSCLHRPSVQLRTSARWFIRLTHEPQTSHHWCTPNLILDYNHQSFLFPEKIMSLPKHLVQDIGIFKGTGASCKQILLQIYFGFCVSCGLWVKMKHACHSANDKIM